MVYIVGLLSLLAAVYTGNYALETWQDRNRFGAVVLFIIAAATLVAPIWVFAVRHA